MDYSLREIECFIAVAEELSFTRAAKRLNLAQPPLSRHIRALEEKIGAILFLREPRRVSLTAAGNVFYEEVRHVPRRLVRAGEAARRCGQGEGTRLRLGFVSAVTGGELTALLRRFREAHPEVQMLLHDVPPQEQWRALADGRLDGGFVGMAPAETPPGVRLVPWYREELKCFVPVGHPLAGMKSVAWKTLAEEPFIAVSAESAPAFAAHVREGCRAAGFRPKVILESPRAQAVALMVAAGSGIAILPESLAGVAGGSVAALPLRPVSRISHAFACRANRGSEALENLLRLIRAPGGRSVSCVPPRDA